MPHPCERHKTTQRTLFLIFANNYGFPITLSCLAATHFSHHTLNSNNGIVHPPRYLRSRYRSAFHNHNKSFQITLTFHATFEVDVWIHHVAYKFGGFFHKAPTLYRYWETIIVFKWQKQGSLRSLMPLTGWGLHQFYWKFPREQLKARPIECYHFQPASFLIGHTFKQHFYIKYHNHFSLYQHLHATYPSSSSYKTRKEWLFKLF